MQNPDYPHPPVSILFTPDEEIGRGPDHVNLEEVGAAYGYTIDGGLIGEFSYENFNAASAVVTIHGVTAHTGYAKGILKNAIQIAMEYQALLPAYETPACTENREGFYHLDKLQGRTETAIMNYLIRDHDEALFRIVSRSCRRQSISSTKNMVPALPRSPSPKPTGTCMSRSKATRSLSPMS